MDSRTTPCAYHPSEPITNFCSQKECLMPLCPSCIADHTQAHIDKGTLPKFDSINQVVRRADESMERQTQSFLDYKSRLVELASRKQNFKKELVDRLEEAKKTLVAKVEERFEQLKKDSLLKIAASEKEFGFNTNEKINDTYHLANSQFNTLHQLKTTLRTDKNLHFLIKYLATEALSIQTHLGRIESEIRTSEQYQTLIEISPTLSSDIQNVITKSVRVNFILPASHQRLPRTQSTQHLERSVQREAEHRPELLERCIRRSVSPSDCVRYSVQPVRAATPQRGIRPTTILRPSNTNSRDFFNEDLFQKTMPNMGAKDAMFSTISSRMSDSQNKPKERKGLTIHKTYHDLNFS